ncbi:MAG: dodecin family protein [Longimicrobiales bacterium]
MSSIAKVIEVIAESDKSWDDAVKNCLTEVSKTVSDVQEIWISNMKVLVEDNPIARYRIAAKVTFLVKGHV